jgi:hypothetical protein
MRSPFPGMDPYLEGDIWTSFHSEFVVDVARHLTPQLSPKYTARVQKRWVTTILEGAEISTADIYSDVGVRHEEPAPIGRGGTAVAPAPLLIPTALPVERPWHWIEIADVKERQLVACIELLSPANKRGHGREEYLSKRERLLRSETHLLEIDLHRSGARVPLNGELPDAPYFVFLTRANRRELTEVWSIKLDTRLPEVPVPLLPPDGDASLDLQACFNITYEMGDYHLELDYRREPPVRLSAEEREFADLCIQEWLAPRT